MELRVPIALLCWIALGACDHSAGSTAHETPGATQPNAAQQPTPDARASAKGEPPLTSDPARAADASAGAASGRDAAVLSATDGGLGQDAAGRAPIVAPALAHTFESLTIAPGEERTDVCQSWTLDNDQTLYVNKVVSTNQGGFHHSNWIWVDDQSYTGPDGTWPCADRGFDQIFAGAFGGVFFAQSTQAGADVQAFPDGVAFELPPHVRIVGDVHLLNSTEAERTTSLHFDVYTIPEDQVRVKLQPMAFTNTALEVAAGGETRAHMQCAMPQPDFDIYYVLPHFHVLGQRLRIDVAGGDLDGMNIFTSRGSFGDSMGQTFDPPIAVHGALGLGISCDYENPTDSVRHYGVGADEMCVVLIYSTGAKAGGTAIDNISVVDDGGVHDTDALCVAVGT